MTPSELHARALDQLRAGETAGGITDLKAYIATESDDETAWLELATAYASIEHWGDAARSYGHAVELDGSVVDARIGYARALVRVGKLDDAAFQLLQAARVDPGNGRVAKELGIVLYDKRLFDKALTWLQKATELEPADARAHYALGLAHEAKKDMAAAIGAYRDAVARDLAFSDARKTLADALASVGEHEAAIGELEAVLALERSNEQVASNLDVLRRALSDMRARRLVGKTLADLDASALVTEGQLKHRGATAAGEPIRYIGPLVELWATLDGANTIAALMLVLTDPDRAAGTPDDTFRVSIVTKDGRHESADYGTAVSLTFLREALGCPLTHASELYAKLLAAPASALEWGGLSLAIARAPVATSKQERYGICVQRISPNS